MEVWKEEGGRRKQGTVEMEGKERVGGDMKGNQLGSEGREDREWEESNGQESEGVLEEGWMEARGGLEKDRKESSERGWGAEVFETGGITQ